MRDGYSRSSSRLSMIGRDAIAAGGDPEGHLKELDQASIDHAQNSPRSIARGSPSSTANPHRCGITARNS